jgi:tol-pal system protein YbgF
MPRAILLFFASFLLVAPAAAQSQKEGEMLLYIQQLEERVRQLTGDNQRLAYEVNQLRGQLGLPPLAASPEQTGALNSEQPPVGDAAAAEGNLPPAAPQDLGQAPVAATAPDNTDAGAPVDLSTLAGGSPGQLQTPGVTAPATTATPAPAEPTTDTAMVAPMAPPRTTALSGSARDEYDLAYGYILTGDYGLAEESFKAWLASFPNDPQAPDAEFWLGESHLQQGEYRDAANDFLSVYKTAPNSNKGPDALLKLGVSLSALGEKPAACATFTELGRRYPHATESVMSRVRDEQKRAGCSG